MTITAKSRLALLRVEQNDPILTHLLICEPPTNVSTEGHHLAMTPISTDGPALKRLIDGIGDNIHLKDVRFDAPSGLANAVADAECFEALKKNTSIGSLGLSRCVLSHGVGHEVLKAFEENGEYLRKLAVWRCGRMVESSRLTLCATLRGCTSLHDISLTACNIHDELVENLVEAIRGHEEVKKLDLHDNDITSVGAVALSTLLTDPNNSTLKQLDVNNNLIDDIGAKAVSSALYTNRTLTAVNLDENDDISISGWNSFHKVLCDTSSIEATHNSNHTLCMIASFWRFDEDGIIPNYLMGLIELNGRYCKNKRNVRRTKILGHHFNNNVNTQRSIAENLPMELKVLPHMLEWIGAADNDMSRVTMFNVLRQLPALCEIAKNNGI